VLAAAAGDAPIAFLELGLVALGLAALARLAGRLGIPAIPFYLVAGLAVGEGGVAPLDVSADFISLTAEIGVLLLLLALGLEYTGDELRAGLRSGGHCVGRLRSAGHRSTRTAARRRRPLRPGRVLHRHRQPGSDGGPR